ncbi:VOC family protein [Marinobacter salarius]|uniref:VOC family protein n=1 Tax=Marinobacter salarius TaxID=1420917 RepID=UPI00273B8D77|nr:VOC family protein [Marinobacter salarius]MDP4534560.1 VOC family protein [Marinobacter salarius]
MIGYVTIGTNDLELATGFYDELLGILGARRVFEFERGVYYGRNAMEIGVLYPYDGRSATPGSCSMIALLAGGQSEVDRLHTKALSLGAVSEDPPMLFGDQPLRYYGAYFKDLEGNHLCVYCLV